MSLDLGPFDREIDRAVQHFWETRDLAALRQRDRGAADQAPTVAVLVATVEAWCEDRSPVPFVLLWR
jgi:hypothetical protein